MCLPLFSNVGPLEAKAYHYTTKAFESPKQLTANECIQVVAQLSMRGFTNNYDFDS